MALQIDLYQSVHRSALMSIFRQSFDSDFEAIGDMVDEKIIHDPNYEEDLAVVALSDGLLAGFAMGVVRELESGKMGYIKLLLVDKKSREGGISDILIKYLEDKLKDKGVQKVRLFDSPFNYLWPGIPVRQTALLCMAEKQGYKRVGDCVNMSVELQHPKKDLITTTDEVIAKDKGFDFMRVTDERDKIELIAFIKYFFPIWQHELEKSLDLNPSAVFIAKKDDKIIAFSAYEGNNKGTGSFGPMGTHPDYRGHKIGSILLKRALLDLKELGHNKAVIPWVGPYAFYAKTVGAEITSVYWRYEKEL